MGRTKVVVSEIEDIVEMRFPRETAYVFRSTPSPSPENKYNPGDTRKIAIAKARDLLLEKRACPDCPPRIIEESFDDLIFIFISTNSSLTHHITPITKLSSF